MGVIGPFDFRGGYSPGHNFTSVPQGYGYATDMKNCRWVGGSIRPRWAQSVVNSSTLGATYVNGLACWKDTVNSVTALVSTCNSKIQISDITTYVPGATPIAFTDRTGAVTVTNSAALRYTFDSLNGILVIAGNSLNGIAPLKLTAYNTNAASLGGTPPKGDCVKQVNNILFLSRDLSSTANQSNVYWSNYSDPETWPAGNVLAYNKNDGEPVMALGFIGTDLYIFKQTSIGRLGTTSSVISGALTLGPLTTVIRGVGCAGPLAIDNLPNGNIVFVGYDGHFYEFNGSSVIDRSCSPYPGPDAYNNSESIRNCGLSCGIVNTQVVVKVWHGINEVWIGFDSNLNTSSTLFNVFAYDFVQNIWQGYVSSTNPKCFATNQIGSFYANLYESTEILFHGNGSGSVLSRGDFTKQYPVDESGTPTDFRFGTTIKCSDEGRKFIPLSVCYEIDGTSANLSSLSLSATLDSFFNGGSSIQQITGSSPTRNFAKLSLKQDAVGSGILPNFLNLEWIGLGTGSASGNVLNFSQFYVSDEVIS